MNLIELLVLILIIVIAFYLLEFSVALLIVLIIIVILYIAIEWLLSINDENAHETFVPHTGPNYLLGSEYNHPIVPVYQQPYDMYYLGQNDVFAD